MTASAHRALHREPMESPRKPLPEDVSPDGSLVVSREQCSQFGGGNAVAGRRALRALLQSQVLPDGSFVVSPDQCAAFGGGDAAEGRRELRAMLHSLRERKLQEAPVARPGNVRLAEEADEDAALALWKLDIAENAARVATPNDDRLRAHLRAGTQRQFGIVGMIDGPAGPEALSVLIAAQWHWSSAWYWQDLCTFVHPDRRRTRHVHALMDFNNWVVDEMSRLFGYRVYLLTGVLGTRSLWAKTALFRRRYQAVGASFLYPPPPMGD